MYRPTNPGPTKLFSSARTRQYRVHLVTCAKIPRLADALACLRECELLRVHSTRCTPPPRYYEYAREMAQE